MRESVCLAISIGGLAEKPKALKPEPQWLSGSLEDGPGSQPRLRSAVPPSQTRQVVPTVLVGREELIELNKIARGVDTRKVETLLCLSGSDFSGKIT